MQACSNLQKQTHDLLLSQGKTFDYSPKTVNKDDNIYVYLKRERETFSSPENYTFEKFINDPEEDRNFDRAYTFAISSDGKNIQPFFKGGMLQNGEFIFRCPAFVENPRNCYNHYLRLGDLATKYKKGAMYAEFNIDPSLVATAYAKADISEVVNACIEKRRKFNNFVRSLNVSHDVNNTSGLDLESKFTYSLKKKMDCNKELDDFHVEIQGVLNGDHLGQDNANFNQSKTVVYSEPPSETIFHFDISHGNFDKLVVSRAVAGNDLSAELFSMEGSHKQSLVSKISFQNHSDSFVKLTHISMSFDRKVELKELNVELAPNSGFSLPDKYTFDHLKFETIAAHIGDLSQTVDIIVSVKYEIDGQIKTENFDYSGALGNFLHI